MKRKLLEHLRCPECGGRLALAGPSWHPAHPEEAVSGELRCDRGGTVPAAEEVPRRGGAAAAACGRDYPVRSGVPCFLERRTQTGSAFGYLWSRALGRAEETRPSHYRKMERALSLGALRGLVLDAGCGEGIEMADAARNSEAEIIGLELSDGGSRASFERTLGLPRAHVVQADLKSLPFAPETFDFVYSYGVLHHLSDPPRGMREIVRVLKRGARAALYLYEDFSERSPLLRGLLELANAPRRLTVRMPHRLLYGLCWVASPVVVLLFTVPHRLLRSVPGGRRLAEQIPFRNGSGPFSLAGDLYDRFGAPVERRYSRSEAEHLLRQAGLEGIVTGNDRGWMVAGTKPDAAVARQEIFRTVSGLVTGGAQ